jgi:hypothetical protein
MYMKLDFKTIKLKFIINKIELSANTKTDTEDKTHIKPDSKISKSTY